MEHHNGVFRREVPAGEFTLVEVERYRVGSYRIKNLWHLVTSCEIGKPLIFNFV